MSQEEEQVDSEKEDGEAANLGSEPERHIAPAAKAIIDLTWPSGSVEEEELKVRYGPSRATGDPGNEWMDEYPLSFGIAPYWQQMFSELKREAIVINHDGDDKSGEDTTEEAAGDGFDLEAGLRPAHGTAAGANTAFVSGPKKQQLEEAYGPVHKQLTEAIISDNRDENSIQLLQAAKDGDVILLSLLIREITVPLEEIVDDQGCTALHCAVMRGHTHCFKALVKDDTASKVRARRGPGLDPGRPGGFAADYLYTCHPHLWPEYEAMLTPSPQFWDDEFFEPRNLLFETLRNEVAFNRLIEAISSESGVVDKERLNRKNSNGLTLLETSLVTEKSPMLSRLIDLGAQLPEGRPLRVTRFAFPPSAESSVKLEKLLTSIPKFSTGTIRLELTGMELNESLKYILTGGKVAEGMFELSLSGCRHRAVDADWKDRVLWQTLHALTPTCNNGCIAIDLSGIPLFSSDTVSYSIYGRFSYTQHLRKLQLRDCGIDNRGFQDLVSNSIHRSLQHLDIRSNKIDSQYETVLDLLRRSYPCDRRLTGKEEQDSDIDNQEEFHLLLFGNKLSGARLEAKMRKFYPYKKYGYEGGSKWSETNLYDMVIMLGHRVDILAGVELKKACEVPSSGGAKLPTADATAVFATRAAYLPGYCPEVKGKETTLPCCCQDESRAHRIVSASTPLLHVQHQGQERLQQGELLALREPHGAKKTRELAAQRALPDTWSSTKIKSVQRARAWPGDKAMKAKPSQRGVLQRFGATSSFKEEKHQVILQEVSKILNFKSPARQKVAWPANREAERHMMMELHRIAEQKVHDLEFAQEAAAKGQCPGDLTPVRPRTYQAAYDSGDDPGGKVQLDRTAFELVGQRFVNLDESTYAWPTTKSEAMREWLYDEPQEPWTTALSKPIWEVFDKNSLDVEVAKQGPSTNKRRQKKEQNEQQVENAGKLSKEARMDRRTLTLRDDLHYQPKDVETENIDSDLKKDTLEQIAWCARQCALPLAVVMTSSVAATFWTLGLKVAVETIELNYDIRLPEIWDGSLPSQAWMTRALSLSMLSAAIAAIPLQVGHYLWWRSTEPYYSGRDMAHLERLANSLSPAVLVLIILWAAAALFLAIPVAMAHSTLCVFDRSQPDCAEGAMHLLRSHKFALPRSAGYSDMLHAALTSSVMALAAVEAIILYRTRQGHYVVGTSSDEESGSVLVTGGRGIIGQQVNGLYLQDADHEHNGRPMFRRYQASQWLYISDDGWHLTYMDKLPTSTQVEIRVTAQLPLWLHSRWSSHSYVQILPENDPSGKFAGKYARGQEGSYSEHLIFRRQKLEGDVELPTCLVGSPNKGRTAIANAVYPENSEQWIQLVDTIMNAHHMYSLDKEAALAARPAWNARFDRDEARKHRMPCPFVNEFTETERDADTQSVFDFFAAIVPCCDKALRSVGCPLISVKESALVKAKDAIKKMDLTAFKRVAKSSSESPEVTFLLYIILFVSGQEMPPEVDRMKPPGLCEWSFVETPDQANQNVDVDKVNCYLKEAGGTGESDLMELRKAAWKLDVSKSSGNAWWHLPHLKATYTPPARWKPRIGDYFYNFHSVFGLQLACKSAAVLLDVCLDFAVVSKFIAGGYLYFTAISLFLIIVPSVACWAFLYANGMMEVRDLWLCLSQTAVVMETYQALGTGKVGQNLLWVAVAEACLESLSQTMFQTYCLLIGYGAGGSNKVLIASVMWGMVNVALVVSMLDHYGRSYTSMGTSGFRWLMRYCEVASRVSTLALFAFFLRPSAVGAEMHKSKQRAIFVLLALDFVVLLLLLSRDKSRGLVNVFWAMISCFLAPPCFIVKFRAFQPVYYAWRLVELIAMVGACVLSGQSIDKVVNSPEAYTFLHIAVISTGLFIILNVIVALRQLPVYLYKFAFKRIVKVRIWTLDERGTAHQAMDSFLPLQGVEIEYDNGTTKRVYEELKQTSRSPGGIDAQRTSPKGSEVAPLEDSPVRLARKDAMELSLKRGEELVEVVRFNRKWRPTSPRWTGVVFATSFGRRWGLHRRSSWV